MLTEQDIAHLWDRMSAIYGHRWLSNFGPRDEGGTWLMGLVNLTPQHLAAGLRACVDRGDDWPPPLPEFCALCFGLPERDRAVQMCIARDWSSPVTDAMRRTLPSFDLQHMSRREEIAHWRAVYGMAVEGAQDELLALPGPSESRVAISP